MRTRLLVVAVLAIGACYSGSRAARGVNEAWRGRSRASIEARWGKPAAVTTEGDATVLVWSHRRRHIRLPTASAEVIARPDLIDVTAELRPGEISYSTTEVVARVDARGIVARVDGPSLRWGPPRDANLRWGVLFGAHVGMGRLDDTSDPLPSGGLYLGGMLSRTVGLVGTFSMVSGKDDAGGAIGFAWGIGVQHWVTAHVALRAGPAMVLAFDPGFEDVGLAPGINGAASFAVLRSGSFVLDLRADVTTSPDETFGSLGLGVNVN